MRLRFAISLIAFLFKCQFSFSQEISIRTDHSYHPFTLGPLYGVLEDVGTEDQGGILYLFVDNLTDVEDSIVSVELRAADGSSSSPYGWYAWPGIMNTDSGMFTGITIKGIEDPMTPGSYCKVIVTSLNGAVDSVEISALEAPDLKLANIVPAQDENSVFIYLRNDGVTEMEIDSLYFNTEAYDDLDAAVQFSGSGIIRPGETEIIRLFGSLPYTEASLAAVRILYHEVPALTAHFTSVSTRIVHPEFHLGSWHSSGFTPDNEFGRKRLRTMGIEMLHGPGNYAEMYDGFNRYYMQTILEPDFGDPFDVDNAIPAVQQLQDSAMIAVWSIDDEPDLNGKDIGEQLEKALTYMRYDTNTAVYVNLAVQSKFQRYGFYADVVGMDHYAAPSAPNVIPGTWIPVIGRTGEALEAYEYMRYLKLNTEPRRNWSWVQFAAGIWDTQAEPEAVNYQFWAQIMAGTKGMEFFTATSDTQDDFPAQWQEGIRLFKEFKQIRNVALYGEPFGHTLASDTQVLTGSLTGPESMAVIAVNNSLTFEGDILAGFTTTWSAVPYYVDVFVPDWITQEDIYMVTEVGKSYDLTANIIAPNTLRITPGDVLDNRSHVFYIGPSDTVSPMDLQGLRVAQYIDSANYTLSWKEPYDNVGVQGYNIYYNNVLVEKVTGLVYEVSDRSLDCSAYWKVEPYDNSGNVGGSDSLLFYLSGPPLEIIAQPADAVVEPGGATVITVIPNSVVSYQWQYYDGITWQNIAETIHAIGTQTASLQLFDVVAPITVRCLLASPCAGSVISEEATVTVDENSTIWQEDANLTVFPNPSTGMFHVVFDTPMDRLEVWDIYGQRIYQEENPGLRTEIDLKDVEPGVYLLIVYTDGGLSVMRVVRM